MIAEQLREYITTNTGHAPHGNLIGRKTLMRMATDVQPARRRDDPPDGGASSLRGVGVAAADERVLQASAPTAPCRRCWRSPTRWRSASPTTRATGARCSSYVELHRRRRARTTFPLPTNYKRMLLTANVWRSSTTQHRRCKFIATPTTGCTAAASSAPTAGGEWTSSARQIAVVPILANGDQIRYFVPRQKLRCAGRLAATASEFQADLDTLPAGRTAAAAWA